jgi:hypothetical protein
MQRSPAIAISMVVACAAVVAGAVVAGCGGGNPDQRSGGHYCAEVSAHLGDLNSPSIATPADVQRTLEAWRAVASSAPLAVQKEWDAMVADLQTAATVKPNDPTSMQKVADSARASEPSANRVISYTYSLCKTTIGAVVPIDTTVNATINTTG